MKKIPFIILAASLFTFSCSAQQSGKKGKAMAKQRLQDSLNLSEAQADSVIFIQNEYQPQIKEIMKDQSLSKDQKKQKVKPLKKQMLARLKDFLDEDQLRKLEQMQQDMHQGKKQKNSG